MYNGIGLQTARGSGTNGYVQRNLAFVKNKKERVDYKTEEELNKLDQGLNKQPNQDILDHERKRKVELKCMEMQELMEEQGYSEKDVADKVNMFRKMLMAKEGVSDTAVEKDEHGRPVARATHQIAQANQEKNNRLKEAFGLTDYVEGSAFDPERKAKEEAAKAAALAQKKYTMVQSSEEEETSAESPSPQKRKKKKSRHDSSSPERKEKRRKSRKHSKRDRSSAKKHRSRKHKSKKRSEEKHKSRRHHSSSSDYESYDERKDTVSLLAQGAKSATTVTNLNSDLQDPLGNPTDRPNRIHIDRRSRSRSPSSSPSHSPTGSHSYRSHSYKRSHSYDSMSDSSSSSRSRSGRRSRSYSNSRSRSRSTSSGTPRRRSRRDSRSPSIRRRRGSPSHLDKRRITSGRYDRYSRSRSPRRQRSPARERGESRRGHY